MAMPDGRKGTQPSTLPDLRRRPGWPSHPDLQVTIMKMSAFGDIFLSLIPINLRKCDMQILPVAVVHLHYTF